MAVRLLPTRNSFSNQETSYNLWMLNLVRQQITAHWCQYFREEKSLHYRPPTKLRKGNVFSRICLSFCPWGVSCDHYLWCIGSHCTGTSPDPPLRHGTSLSRDPLSCPPRHVQTCSLWITYSWQVDNSHPIEILSCSKIFLQLGSTFLKPKF